jgi:pimeloyl-ACP methyl ester carboxylesterase
VGRPRPSGVGPPVEHPSNDVTEPPSPFHISGRRSAETIPGSELVLIEGGPHGINVSHADEFNEALLAFLAR